MLIEVNWNMRRQVFKSQRTLYLRWYITKRNHNCGRKHVNFSFRNSVFPNKSVRTILSWIMMGIKWQTCGKYVQKLWSEKKTAGREHLKTLEADKNKLQRILNKQAVNWISFVWLETRSGNGESNEPCKGKAVPLQAWTGPEGSRRLRLPDFKTIGA